MVCLGSCYDGEMRLDLLVDPVGGGRRYTKRDIDTYSSAASERSGRGALDTEQGFIISVGRGESSFDLRVLLRGHRDCGGQEPNFRDDV